MNTPVPSSHCVCACIRSQKLSIRRGTQQTGGELIFLLDLLIGHWLSPPRIPHGLIWFLGCIHLESSLDNTSSGKPLSRCRVVVIPGIQQTHPAYHFKGSLPFEGVGSAWQRWSLPGSEQIAQFELNSLQRAFTRVTQINCFLPGGQWQTASGISKLTLMISKTSSFSFMMRTEVTWVRFSFLTRPVSIVLVGDK